MKRQLYWLKKKTNAWINQILEIKSPDELARMQKAAEIGDAVFLEIKEDIRPGAVERDIAARIEQLCRRHGAEKTSFPTIVASGSRSAFYHGPTSGKRIEDGDLVVVDFGAVYNGYCSDMTRTLIMGRPTDVQKKMYTTVLQAQENAIRLVGPGKKCVDIDKTARDYFKQFDLDGYFVHGLGHGVGMRIHESPRLSEESTDILKPNMVITIEPGVYVPGAGGVRIEDMVLVTEAGYRVLTHCEKLRL